MRTFLIRGVLALAVLLSAAVAPALAPSVMRGNVVDAQGKPVPDAVVLFEAQGVNRKTQTKTDRNGDFLQVGLSSGEYKVTATKDGIGSQTLPARVSQGQNPPLAFTLAPAAPAAAGGIAAADKEAAAKLQALAAGSTCKSTNMRGSSGRGPILHLITAPAGDCLQPRF